MINPRGDYISYTDQATTTHSNYNLYERNSSFDHWHQSSIHEANDTIRQSATNRPPEFKFEFPKTFDIEEVVASIKLMDEVEDVVEEKEFMFDPKELDI